MAAKKAKTVYICQNCGYQSPKHMGKCSSCNQWNTLVEELIEPEPAQSRNWKATSSVAPSLSSKPLKISEISYKEEQRVRTPDGELNRVLGGGIMPGSVVLIGGEPGIGKSTLMLQISLNLPKHNILYISGEESERQIKVRADRLKETTGTCSILTETNLSSIFRTVETYQPDILIVDSIQTLALPSLESAAGSVSQVRECTAQLIRFAKETHTPVFMVGHITKEGSLAGPKVLEHMVDTVLQFEGDRHMSYRILRTAKNRFGSTAEIGIYEMRSDGLREVTNPSEILLSQRDESLSGITIGTSLEGNRPLLIEIQSLVSASAYGTPQRSCTGFDAKRLNMLLAVLEKRGGFKVSFQDVFLNITGGLKVEDPAIDLAVCMSIISSLEDISILQNICFAAEVGLGGEIRAVNRIENRIAEAEKLGFKKIFVSKYNLKGLDKKRYNISLEAVTKLEDVFEILFKN